MLTDDDLTTKKALLAFCLKKETLPNILLALHAYLKAPNAHIDAAIDDTGWSALHISVLRGDGPTVALLIEHRANINIIAHDINALMIAITQGNPSMVELLLENDAQLESTNAFGQNILTQAKTSKNEAIINLVMEYSKTVRGPLPLEIFTKNTPLPGVIGEIINSYLPSRPQTVNTPIINQAHPIQRANKNCCVIS